MASENIAATAMPDRPDQPRHGKRGAPQAFARKLAEILTEESDDTICWNPRGDSFIVRDIERFSQDVLVKHYRHSKFSSFQRQLNLYQFRKIVKGPDAGGYQHPMFHRERPSQLCFVRRSVSGSGAKAKGRNSSKQAKGGDAAAAGRAPPRAHKSGAALRRVGKLRNKAVVPASASASAARAGDNNNRNPSSASSTSFAQLVTADHRQAAVALAPPAAEVFSAEPASLSDAGERSPWTSGESSDSDASIAEASVVENKQRGGAGKRVKEPAGRVDDSSDSREDGDAAEEEEGLLLSSDNNNDSGGDERPREATRRRAQKNPEPREEGGGDAAGGASQVVGAAAAGGQQRTTAPATARKSTTLNFFKKTFSFMDRQSTGRTSSVDAGGAPAAAGAAAAAASEQRPVSPASSSSNLGVSPVSPLMVDTSAAARAAAAGLGVSVSGRSVRPPPVTVTGGGHRVPMDPSTAAGNKALTSSPLTPKSSMEAAALAAAAAAAAAAAMPPPPKRDSREELGLVEQLTNMVEVFDICDLLRKVSTSNSSRLDKHGGIVKPNGPQHLRNMSVDTDQGLPQSPVQGGGRQEGQSPTGLGSLASMELVRDSSKDWDTLMAGSADVSDLGNTMVQSVAEFFSF